MGQQTWRKENGTRERERQSERGAYRHKRAERTKLKRGWSEGRKDRDGGREREEGGSKRRAWVGRRGRARIPERSVPLHIPHISQVQGVVPCRQYRLQTRAVAHSRRHVDDVDRQPD